MLKNNNIITEHLPDIFHGYESPLNSSLDIDDLNKDNWTEFIAHLSQFNNLSVDKTHLHIKKIILNDRYKDDPAIQAGLAKCYIAEGKFVDAIKTLGYALSLLDKSNPDTQAFVLLEMVNLLTVIGSREHSIHLLKTGKMIVKSKYISSLYDYYELVNKIRNGNYNLINRLIKSGEYFKKNNQFATLAFHYKNIGNAFGKIKDFDSEKNYYSKALLICEKHNYREIKSAIDHDIAMSFFRAGDKKQAIRKLKITSENAKSFFTKAYTLGNIGFINFRIKKYKSSFKYFKKSIDIASENGVFHLIPSMCYYLGKSQQKLSDHSSALLYFKKGYHASMELAKLKFPIKGERLFVIDEYVKNLENVNSNTLGSKKEPYDFAIEKTLDEIRGVFKNTVLRFFFDQSNSIDEVVKTLKMSPSSYFKIKNKYKKYDDEDILYPQYIVDFIQNHSELKWKDLNTQFEKEMLMYLLKHYKYNKKVLSEKLNVNYSRLVAKIKEFEKNDEN